MGHVIQIPDIQEPSSSVQNTNAAPAIGNIQQYSIVANSIPTTITVPGSYPTLTGTNGAFDMINKGVLSGNTVINLTGYLVEPGTIALNIKVNPIGTDTAVLSSHPLGNILVGATKAVYVPAEDAKL